MEKMWAGRTSGATDSIADDFNSSIRFDCRMYRQDITGSMAHAAMLGAQGTVHSCGTIINDMNKRMLALELNKWESKATQLIGEAADYKERLARDSG